MYLLDTNICIYAMKNSSTGLTAKLLQTDPADICISSVTLSELEYGIAKSKAPDRNRRALYQFLAAVPVLDYDSSAAQEYGDIQAALEKAGTPIGPMDLMIAAHARSCGCTIVTKNCREFLRICGLRTENWA